MLGCVDGSPNMEAFRSLHLTLRLFPCGLRATHEASGLSRGTEATRIRRCDTGHVLAFRGSVSSSNEVEFTLPVMTGLRGLCIRDAPAHELLPRSREENQTSNEHCHPTRSPRRGSWSEVRRRRCRVRSDFGFPGMPTPATSGQAWDFSACESNIVDSTLSTSRQHNAVLELRYGFTRRQPAL